MTDPSPLIATGRLLSFPAPADPDDCDDYIVGWGNRNRIGDEEVLARAEFVVSEILPGLPDADVFFDELPFPTPMRKDVDWWSNLELTVPALSVRALAAPTPDRTELRNRRVRMDVGEPHR